MSVLFESAIFISELISYKTDNAAFVCIVFTAVIYGISSVSRNKKTWLIKWLISIPFSYVILQYFWSSDYAVRALNYVIPDHGKPSAGGNFAGFLLFAFQTAACLISGIAALFIKPKNYETFEKIQIGISSVSAVITAAFVVISEQRFPSYEYIISNM